jgi:RimJ/RimL family protein N-acetyltransferase
MTDKILHIVPYQKGHGAFILSQQMNHVLMDKDAEFDGDAMNLEEQGLAFTGIVNNEPIFAAGMKPIWKGVAEGWVLATSKVWNHPLLVAKAIKKDFEKVAKQHNIRRVQTAVRSEFGIGIRFAKWLGLENEGLMKQYGFDGTDHYRFARLF